MYFIFVGVSLLKIENNYWRSCGVNIVILTVAISVLNIIGSVTEGIARICVGDECEGVYRYCSTINLQNQYFRDYKCSGSVCLKDGQVYLMSCENIVIPDVHVTSSGCVSGLIGFNWQIYATYISRFVCEMFRGYYVESICSQERSHM